MKATRFHFLAVLVVWGLALPLAKAAVIVGDAVIVSNPPGQLLQLTNSIPSGQGWFAIQIDPLGGSQFRFSYYAIAEQYALYGVSLGETVDTNYALTHTPLVSNNGTDPGSSVQMFALNESKYFGYWDDRFHAPVGKPDDADNYGWVQITRTASGFVVTGSVTALGYGIVVGTTTQVPGPGAAALVALAGLVSRRRRFI